MREERGPTSQGHRISALRNILSAGLLDPRPTPPSPHPQHGPRDVSRAGARDKHYNALLSLTWSGLDLPTFILLNIHETENIHIGLS